MRSMDISDSTFEQLKARCAGPDDTPETLIRQLLGIVARRPMSDKGNETVPDGLYDGMEVVATSGWGRNRRGAYELLENHLRSIPSDIARTVLSFEEI